MKRVFKYLGILLVVFICTGCGNKYGDVTRGIRHAGFAVSGDTFVCNVLLPQAEGDEVVTPAVIWYFGSSHMITDAGKVYDISLGQGYMNGENCKAASLNDRVIAIMDESVVKVMNGKYYSLATYTEITTEDKNYNLYDILLKGSNVRKIVTVDSSNNVYYVLKSDGNVYEVTLTKADYKSPYTVSSSEIIYSRGVYGDIVDFRNDSNTEFNYILAKGSLNRTLAANASECSKYADVNCNYKMQEDPELFAFWDYVFAYNGSTIITTYGKVFTAN